MREVLVSHGGLRAMSPDAAVFLHQSFPAGDEIWELKQGNSLELPGKSTLHHAGRTFADLPHELIVAIMEWLPVRDLRACRLVCHSFNKCASEQIYACTVKGTIPENVVEAARAYRRLQALSISGDAHSTHTVPLDTEYNSDHVMSQDACVAAHDTATDVAFACLGALSSLVLQYVVVSDRTLLHVSCSLSRLTDLRLESLPFITDDGMRFVRALPNLASLALVHVPINDTGLAALADSASPLCTSLEMLTLSGIRASDAGLQALSAGMANLRRLELAHLDDISNDTLRCLAASASLASLRLAHLPYITDAGLEVLGAGAMSAVELCGLVQVTHNGVLAVGRSESVKLLVLAYLPKVKGHAIQDLAERIDLDLRVFGMRIHW